jgi:hypothetical protein
LITTAGDRCDLTFSGHAIDIQTASGDAQSLDWSELINIEIAGPGNVTRGGGFIGGGFGLDGAAEGMLVASVLNALTTRSSIQSLLGLLFRHQELWVLHDVLEPLALRVEMAPVFARMRSEAVPE